MEEYIFIFKTNFTTNITAVIVSGELLVSTYYFKSNIDTLETILETVKDYIPKKVILIGRTSLLKELADYYEKMEVEIEWR